MSWLDTWQGGSDREPRGGGGTVEAGAYGRKLEAPKPDTLYWWDKRAEELTPKPVSSSRPDSEAVTSDHTASHWGAEGGTQFYIEYRKTLLFWRFLLLGQRAQRPGRVQTSALLRVLHTLLVFQKNPKNGNRKRTLQTIKLTGRPHKTNTAAQLHSAAENFILCSISFSFKKTESARCKYYKVCIRLIQFVINTCFQRQHPGWWRWSFWRALRRWRLSWEAFLSSRGNAEKTWAC